MSFQQSLDVFVHEIIDIKVLHMGGAAAGIVGSSGADNDSLNTLKRATVTFAEAYSKPKPDYQALDRLAAVVDGSIHALQLTNTLAPEHADHLHTALQQLMNHAKD